MKRITALLLLLGVFAFASDKDKYKKAAPAPRAAAKVAAPGAGGRAAARPGAPGRSVVKSPGGHGPDHNVTTLKGGAAVHKDPSGKVVEVHTAHGAVIRHEGGVRHVEMVRPNGHVIVAHGRNGYVQRPFESHGGRYVSRTYMRDGHAYNRLYRPWLHGGRDYHFYARNHYYRPGYYSWAYSPYRHPYPYAWGYAGSPWYGYYGSYYAPYPVYASPAFWLTDFVLAATLQAAYINHYPGEMRSALIAEDVPPVSAMPPEVKQALADEIKREIEQAKAEQEAAGNPAANADAVPVMFTDNGPKVFLVTSETSATMEDKAITLAEGDVLQLVATPVPDDESTKVKLVAGRSNKCSKDCVLTVKTEDLLEMQNQMQASLDQGMDKLQENVATGKQAKDAFPGVPAKDAGFVDAPYAKDIPKDEGVAEELAAAVKEADQDEQATLDAAEIAEARAAREDAVAAVVNGMKIEAVKKLLGDPMVKKDQWLWDIYEYPELRLQVTGGVVIQVTPK